MPRTRHNEVTGDFLHRLYDQRMVFENGNLNIYDPDARGGRLLRSTPSDLVDMTQRDVWVPDLIGQGDSNQLGLPPLAWTPDALYMAGVQAGANGAPVVYKLPPDGSCAKQSCAVWANHNLPYGFTNRGPDWGGPITPTALAVGTTGTTSMLAVGLNAAYDTYDAFPNPKPGGLYLIDAASGSTRSTFLQFAEQRYNQTVVTSLAWDDRGSGLLAIGTMCALGCPNLHAVRVAADGILSNYTHYDLDPTPSAFSAAVGHRVDGSPVIAFGQGPAQAGQTTVSLWDPAVTSTTLLSQFSGSGDTDAVDALTFTDRIDGTAGVPDLVAVSSHGNSARVLRYSGGSTLTPLAVAPQGGTTTDVGGIRAWFPGYKTGTLSVANFDSESDVQLDFATRPNAAYGCWFLQGPPAAGVFDPPPPLPTSSAVLHKLPSNGEPAFLGATTSTLTAGEGGDCAATDFTGQWAAYVVAAPLGRPADRTVAKLVWSKGGELTMQSVGGPLQLQIGRLGDELSLGSWGISIEAPPPPGAPATLTMTGTRLDPAGTDRPVYRFDVAPTTWALPPSTPSRVETVLPPLEVRGKTAAGSDVPLGLLVPQGQPARDPSGSVSLSPESFYWQNPGTGQQITDLYVQVGQGADATRSASLNLAGLPAPVPGTTVAQLVVCPATGSASCDAKADPVANGLDQAPLRIQTFDANGQVLPLSDPSYGQIYYRDQDGDLVTGLIPADGSTYIRVSPYAGAYPNDGSTGSSTSPSNGGAVGGRFGYLSTTSTAEQEVTAHLGGSTEASAPIVVGAITFTPQVPAGAQAGPGFFVNGCTSDYTGTNFCRLAEITSTAPGLFLTTDPDSRELRIGLQFATTALTSLTSLPLQQVAGQPEHTVAADPLVIDNGEVHLDTTSGFQPGDLIDTWLVTHGTQLPVRAVKVGGGN